MKLENLADHSVSCEYNSNYEIVCDKGCNMSITRREYKDNNCFSHLANRLSAQEKEIKKLRIELSEQREHFERLINAGDGKSSNVSFTPQKWLVCYNAMIQEPNILKVNNPSTFAFVQSEQSLVPTKYSFKVHLSGTKNWRHLIWIGLTRRGHRTDREPERGSIVYCGGGLVIADAENVPIGPEWKDGDIIECGIKFSTNFIQDGDHSASVYFHRNDELIIIKPFKIPRDGFFPTICFAGRNARVKYMN